MVCYDAFESKLFKAIFTLAYFGLFRISELVAPANACAGNQIRGGDLFLFEDGIRIGVRLVRSKTSQRGPPITFKIPKQSIGPCPVKAVTDYLAVAPMSHTAFCHMDAAPVTRQQVTAVLEKCIKRAGLDTSVYKTHSFRIGRATDLAAHGCPHDMIMKLGRWSSDSFKRYIRI